MSALSKIKVGIGSARCAKILAYDLEIHRLHAPSPQALSTALGRTLGGPLRMFVQRGGANNAHGAQKMRTINPEKCQM